MSAVHIPPAPWPATTKDARDDDVRLQGAAEPVGRPSTQGPVHGDGDAVEVVGAPQTAGGEAGGQGPSVTPDAWKRRSEEGVQPVDEEQHPRDRMTKTSQDCLTRTTPKETPMMLALESHVRARRSAAFHPDNSAVEAITRPSQRAERQSPPGIEQCESWHGHGRVPDPEDRARQRAQEEDQGDADELGRPTRSLPPWPVARGISPASGGSPHRPGQHWRDTKKYLAAAAPDGPHETHSTRPTRARTRTARC